MSRRQEIVEILKTRLQNISVSNGYANDIVRVDEWIVAKMHESDMPALVLRDVSSSADNGVSGSTGYRLSVEIDILVSDKATTMQKLRSIMSDVLRAIGESGDDFVEYRTFDGDEILVEHQERLYGGCRMRFTIFYDAVVWEM